ADRGQAPRRPVRRVHDVRRRRHGRRRPVRDRVTHERHGNSGALVITAAGYCLFVLYGARLLDGLADGERSMLLLLPLRSQRGALSSLAWSMTIAFFLPSAVGDIFSSDHGTTTFFSPTPARPPTPMTA